MCSVLLLLLGWPVSSMPHGLFCQNIERQIESILNLLQTITSKVTPLNTTKLKESKPILNRDQCTLAQTLTNCQACDLDQLEIKEISYMKAETKGLVDNLQSSEAAGCVLSPAMCPYSDLPVWKRINTVLGCWFEAVAACNNEIQSMCSSSTHNST